jgi:hypothetical protein
MADSETASQNGSDDVIIPDEKPAEKEKPQRNAEKSVADYEEQERQEAEEKKKLREPPIIFKDLIDVSYFDFILLHVVKKIRLFLASR